MKKRDFFLKAINAGRFSDKAYIIRAFSIVFRNESNTKGYEDMQPWDIIYEQHNGAQQVRQTFVDDTGYIVSLEDHDGANNEPPFKYDESITLQPGDLPNVKEVTKTRYGNVLANWLLSVYPFGDKIPFITGKFGVKKIEGYIEKQLVGDDDPKKDDSITIDEYLKYRTAAGLLDGLTQICVPSLSEKALTGHPDRVKVRERLLKENEGRLHDPSVVAKIDAELVKLDREWLKDDPSLGFYYKDKSFTNVRKKMYYMHGIETAFGDGTKGTLIEKPLSEGWDISKLPEYANSLREGSFDRSASTALGGEAVKFILRVMQNTQIEEDDCGSKLGFPYSVTDTNKTQIIGNYILIGNQSVLLTEDNVGQYVGKEVSLRSPMFCRTERSGFCKTCIGERYAESRTGLATAASNIGSIMMGIFMSRTHVSEVKVAKYDFKKSLT